MATPIRATNTPSLASLQAHLQQLVAQGNRGGGVNNSDAIARTQAAINALGTAGAGRTAAAGEDRIAESRRKLFENTEGRADELRKDPNQQAIMDYLRSVVSGKEVPFSDTATNAMRAQFGRGAASAEAAQMQALRESLGASGGSIYDPGYQAASREAMSERQGRNLDYAGQLAAQTSIENANARSRGASQMAAANMGQNAQINQMLQAGANFRSQDSTTTPMGGGMPMVTATQQGGGGGGYRPPTPMPYIPPQPAPQPQPAPRQAAAPTPSAPRPAQTQPTSPVPGYAGPAGSYRGQTNTGPVQGPPSPTLPWYALPPVPPAMHGPSQYDENGTMLPGSHPLTFLR